MTTLLTLLLFCAPLAAAPGALTLEEAIALLCGASDITEVAEEDFERLQSLHNHHLRINLCRRGSLQSAGIFTQYQVETILDYRSRNGDILSREELAIVDGFTPSLAAALSFFVDFRQSSATPWSAVGSPSRDYSQRPSRDYSKGPSQDSSKGTSLGSNLPVDGEVSSGVSYKINEGKGSWQWQAKGTVQVEGTPGGDFSLSLATKSPWGDAVPETLGWNVSYSDPQDISQTIIGCFNARLGQGLLLWSGTLINSYDKPSSLMKRPTGLVPYGSYSPSYALSGIAANINAGRLIIRPFIDFGTYFTDISASSTIVTSPSTTAAPAVKTPNPLKSFGGNIAWNHPHGQAGLNAVLYGDSQGYSIDFQHTVAGVVLYGEAAVTIRGIGWAGYRGISLVPSALIGTTFRAGPVETGIRLSYAPSSSSSSTPTSSSSKKPNTHNAAVAVSWLSDNRCHLIEGGATAIFETKQLPATSTQKAFPQFSAKSVKSRITYTATPDFTWKFVSRVSTSSAPLSTTSSSSARPALPTKLDLRQDASWSNSNWRITARANFAFKNTPAALGYLEAGYRREISLLSPDGNPPASPQTASSGSLQDGSPQAVSSATSHSSHSSLQFSAYAMAGIFKVDTWDDRIYVYIRDTPGNFGSQAMYGRGYWLSVTASAKFQKRYSLHFRILYTDSPWARPQDTHKKASLSARLSFQFRF